MSDLKELSQSQVPLERVAPLNSNRLVTFVNHFIISIVQQLNELSSVVDSRLYDINNQIFRCNANLIILEMKLNSISGLSSVSSVVTADNNQNTGQTNDIPLPQTTTSVIDTNNGQQLPQNEVNNDSVKTESTNDMTKSEDNQQIEETEEKEAEEPEDPRIAKYRKMIHLGIPLQAVQQKMQMEGMDPQLLSA